MTTAQLAGNVPLRDDVRVMGLVGTAHGTSHFMHMLLPPLFPVFISDLGLSYAQVGLLVTVFFVISGLGQASSGFLVDRVGARPVLFAALGVFVCAALAAANATSYPWLIAAAALAGLGNSPFHPVDFSILNQRVSPARLGYAYSVHGLSGSLGWALTPAVLLALTSVMHWRQAYLVIALIVVVVIVLLLLNRDALTTTTDAQRKATAAPGNTGMQFLKLPVVWWCFAFFLFSTVTLAVIQSFSASILKAVHGVSFAQATATLSAYMLASALGMAAGGWVTARSGWSGDRVIAGCMSVAALMLVLAGTGVLGGTLTMVVLAATGFAVGIGGPSRDMLIKRATPAGATGRVYGTVYSGLDIGFALSPLIFGSLMDGGHYSATLYGAAGFLLLAVFAARGVAARTPARG
jgi:MFS transporter, FSR family, fosmidomycin resistance protein